MANNIIDIFNEYFEMVPAISDDLKYEVYKLRYQVYCIENAFENREYCPNEMEFDDFDNQSVHYLIRHRNSGNYAATTRLILPDAPNPKKLFPLENYCKIDNFEAMKSVSRKHLGEVSRFCISEAFKRRKNEAHTLASLGSDDWQDYFTQDERRVFPHLSLALMACFIRASHENNIHYLFASVEPSFLRFVSPLGINLVKIGPLVDYHGNRLPVMIKIADMLDCIGEKNLDIWDFLTNKGCFSQSTPIIEKLTLPKLNLNAVR